MQSTPRTACARDAAQYQIPFTMRPLRKQMNSIFADAFPAITADIDFHSRTKKISICAFREEYTVIAEIQSSIRLIIFNL